MSQQIYQSEIATQKQTDLDQSSPEQAKPKDKSILQRLDFSTSTLNDHKDNSSHIDNLLCSSFIELDHFVEREQETSNLDTGQSFFKRNNHPFLSDFAQQDQKKISHKKVQCQIGKGYYLSQTQPSKNLINKFKTLQVLKMAKLLKLVLKQLKQGISSLSKEIKINDQQNRQKLYQLSLMFQEKVTSINLEMKYKNTKIADLQRENEMLNYQLSQLKQDLQYQMEENVCSLKNIEEYKQITTLEIDRLQNEKKQNIAELSQRLQKCEVSNSLLQDEINNLNETILEQETLNKKLQYQKKLLQNDYEEISQKSQEWLKKSLEHQITFSQDCIEFYRSDGELSQLIKLNHLYLQEIQKYKTEIQKVREENLLIKKHSDIYVAEQLYNLRDQYERKYKELQNESRKKGNQKQNNQNFVEVCKKNQSQGSNFKNKQKRSINTQTFRQSINSLKKTHSHQEYDSQVTNSLPPQKQNQKNSNLGGKKIAKNLLQQIKDPLPFQNHNTLSIKGSLDQIDISGEVVFRANQHVKGKLKLSNLLYSYKEASISVNMKSTETSPNSQNIQGKEVRKNFSNFMKN